MPYIKQRDRDVLDAVLLDLSEVIETEGDLNYVISRLVARWTDNAGGNYAAINSGIGALECAKLELYRRLAVPYEDVKIAINGDVQEYGPAATVSRSA